MVLIIEERVSEKVPRGLLGRDSRLYIRLDFMSASIPLATAVLIFVSRLQLQLVLSFERDVANFQLEPIPSGVALASLLLPSSYRVSVIDEHANRSENTQSFD